MLRSILTVTLELCGLKSRRVVIETPPQVRRAAWLALSGACAGGSVPWFPRGLLHAGILRRASAAGLSLPVPTWDFPRWRLQVSRCVC